MKLASKLLNLYEKDLKSFRKKFLFLIKVQAKITKLEKDIDIENDGRTLSGLKSQLKKAEAKLENDTEKLLDLMGKPNGFDIDEVPELRKKLNTSSSEDDFLHLLGDGGWS